MWLPRLAVYPSSCSSRSVPLAGSHLFLLWLPLPAWSLHLFAPADLLLGFFCVRKAPHFQIPPSLTASCLSVFCSATLHNGCPLPPPPPCNQKWRPGNLASHGEPSIFAVAFFLLCTWHSKYGFTYCLSLLSRLQMLWNKEVCFVPWHIPKGWTISWLLRYQQCLVDK